MTQGTLFQAVPSRSGGILECPECHAPFEPYKRSEGRQVYCSPDCRTRHWKAEQAPPKLTRAEKILERLRQGPATGLELLQAGGGTRYGARLHDLREKGYQITTTLDGEWPTYRLDAQDPEA